jgi:WD40 repeat protein
MVEEIEQEIKRTFKLQLQKREEIINILLDFTINLLDKVGGKNYFSSDSTPSSLNNLENLFKTLRNSINYDEIDLSQLQINIENYFKIYLSVLKSESVLNIKKNEFITKEKYKNLHYDIFKYLNSKDLISLSLTNKKIKESCDDNQKYWNKIYFKEFDYFLNLDNRDQCEIIEEASEKYNSNPSFTRDIDLKSKYTELKRLNKNWESERPVVTTISTSGCVTCLHLDPQTNELIYSAADGSASKFRLYSYRKRALDEELYMQHHKSTKICDLVSSFHGHGGSIWALDRHEDLLFTGSYDKTIKLWQSKTGSCISTIRAHNSWVSSVNYDPKKEILCSSSWDSTIKLWNIKTLQNTLTIQGENGNYIYCVRSNLDQDEIITGNEWKLVDIWDINRRTKSISFVGHTSRVTNLKLFRDIIFSGSTDKQARVWDKRSGKCEFIFSGHSKGITQVEYDYLNQRVFTASNDKTIKVWDLRKNKEIRTLVGHSEAVCSIAFDQTKLISGSKDNSIRIWNFLN